MRIFLQTITVLINYQGLFLISNDRDYYMSAEEAKKYGIVDKIIK
ncbi:MAG: ATP-dependent Clp protease proteolytic subunit [Candidatus Moranbacteria bacterium]|nr:ATP-dependent Clp protease proteolytic subunit [Candidatus Moranbacteria bacterium]